ncbi:glycogen debranching N-terminal domain-containing protein, partial [Streptomyces sp. NPDC002491]
MHQPTPPSAADGRSRLDSPRTASTPATPTPPTSPVPPVPPVPAVPPVPLLPPVPPIQAPLPVAQTSSAVRTPPPSPLGMSGAGPGPAAGQGVRGTPRFSSAGAARLASTPPGRGSVPLSGPRTTGLPPAHTAMICVALPGLAVSSDQGQLTGRGLDGVYRAGRRILSRCLLRVAGREPLVVQARMTSADCARFVAALRVTPHGGPDPDVIVERTRSADGVEQITLRSAAARPLRLPVEVALGADLADLGAIAAGAAGPELPASVHDSGLRWSGVNGTSYVTAQPPPADAIAAAGLLRWEFDIPPGGSVRVELRVRLEGAGPVRTAGRAATSPLAPASADGDDPRVRALLATSVRDLRALLVRDPAHPADTHLAAGAPWRCGLAPADALAAA